VVIVIETFAAAPCAYRMACAATPRLSKTPA